LLQSGGLREHLIRGSEKISRAREIIIIVSILISALVLLRPQYGDKLREVKSEGSDVMVALDVSPSMLAEDVGVSRLQRSKDAIRWIVDSLEGDRIGLILFSGDAFLQCPLTNDYGAFIMFLNSAGPDSINLKGTDIGRALEEAYRVFQKKRLTSKVLVLITDGEDHEGTYERAVAKFRDIDVSVYTVGVGKRSGEVIPVSEEDSDTDENYYRDGSGSLVKTKKNPGLLKQIAGKTRGGYIDISSSFSGLKFILDIIEDQQKNRYGSRIIKEPKEYFQVFAFLLVILLSVELILPERKA
jgi:Ca-activated chloride channel family protein